MKKILGLLALLAIIFTVAGCAVNTTTGLISIENTSDKDISNIKIGTTYVGFIAKGAKYDLYYTSAVTGTMSATGIDNYSGHNGVTMIKDPNLNFKLNYWYTLYLSKSSSDNTYGMNAMYGFKVGGTSADVDYPAK
jgi:hypothetical protein